MNSWFGWTLVALFVVEAADAYYAYRWYFSRDGSSLRKSIVVPQSPHQLEESDVQVGSLSLSFER